MTPASLDDVASQAIRQSGVLLASVALLMGWPGAAGAIDRADSEAPAASTFWLGADEQPLPFANDADVEAFLRQSRVISMKDLPDGSTKPKKLLLERDGVRAHAIFRHFARNLPKDKSEHPSFRRTFRDSYQNDLAAYRLNQLLGFGRMAPMVERRIEGQRGVVQLWIERAMTGTKRQRNKVEPPDQIRFDQQLQMMRVFDALITNIDRNTGNYLIDGEWTVWLIDHTRSFVRQKGMRPFPLDRGIDRRGFGRLKEVSEEEIRTALRPHLRGREIKDLLKRRWEIVKRFEEALADRGAETVFF